MSEPLAIVILAMALITGGYVVSNNGGAPPDWFSSTVSWALVLLGGVLIGMVMWGGA